MGDPAADRVVPADTGGLPAAPPGTRRAALAGDTVAYAVDAAVHVGDAAGGLREVAVLEAPPLDLALSPSGRYLLAHLATARSSSDRLAVVDLADGRRTTIDAHPDRPRAALGAIARLGGDEVLVVARRMHVLEVLDLAGGQVLGEARDVSAFLFHVGLRPMLDGASVVALGNYWSEGKDSFLTVSLPELLDDPAAAGTEGRRRRGPWDYAHRLAAGPCGPDALVAYRDPEDSEDPDDDDPPLVDTEGMRGFYVRRLRDKRLVETVPYDGPVPNGAPLVATDDVIVAGVDGAVVVLPRAGNDAAPVRVDAAAHALDPATARALVVRPDGTTTVLHLGERRP